MYRLRKGCPLTVWVTIAALMLINVAFNSSIVGFFTDMLDEVVTEHMLYSNAIVGSDSHEYEDLRDVKCRCNC